MGSMLFLFEFFSSICGLVGWMGIIPRRGPTRAGRVERKEGGKEVPK